ncbi:N-acetylmuramoyl-L-alanine amidase family protein [Peptococcaceae bacterium 1198_IL3148]
MKRSLTLLIFLGIIMLLLPVQAFAGNIDVYVDGNQLTFDSPPIIDNNRTLVPFRYIFEALGAEVSFDAATRTAIGTKDNLTIRLPINQNKGYINNEAVQLDVASQLIKGRTLVPLRFIGESMGCEVEAKNSASGMVINITSKTDNDHSSSDPIPVAARSLSDLEVEADEEQFVLELEVEEGVNNSFTLSNPYRLVLDLENTAWQKADIPSFDCDFVAGIRVAQNQETKTRVVLDLNQPVTFHLDQQEDKLIVTVKPKHVWKPDYNVVVLDAGHGGGDVGAIGYSGAYEKNLVIDITQLVEKKLADKGFKVVMTRPGDQTRSLAERVEIANQTNAFAFVSIHANTAASRQATGLEVYTKRGSDHTFAKIMVDSILAQTGQNNRGDREADFYVIKNTVMPAILIETGFISNPQEEQFLWNKANQEKIAEGIVNGIINFRSKFVR